MRSGPDIEKTSKQLIAEFFAEIETITDDELCQLHAITEYNKGNNILKLPCMPERMAKIYDKLNLAIIEINKKEKIKDAETLQPKLEENLPEIQDIDEKKIILLLAFHDLLDTSFEKYNLYTLFNVSFLKLGMVAIPSSYEKRLCEIKKKAYIKVCPEWYNLKSFLEILTKTVDIKNEVFKKYILGITYSGIEKYMFAVNEKLYPSLNERIKKILFESFDKSFEEKLLDTIEEFIKEIPDSDAEAMGLKKSLFNFHIKMKGLKHKKEQEKEILNKISHSNFNNFKIIDSSKNILSSSDQSIDLDKAKENIIARMHYFDAQKYPKPPYEYKKYFDEKSGLTITKVTYNPAEYEGLDDKDKSEKLKIKEQNAIAVRKLNIIGGVLLGLEYDGFLGINKTNKDDYNKKIKYLTQELMLLAEKVEVDLSETRKLKDIIAEFYLKVAATIKEDSSITNLSLEEIVEKISSEKKSPETYFAGEYHNSDEILIVETVNGFKQKGKDEHGNDKTEITSTIQVDVPIGNQLTDNLKIEYQRIHEENNIPKWFEKLEEWEQNFLRENIPKASDTEDETERKWIAFEKRFKSSTLVRIPGIPNARTSYLYSKTEHGQPELISRSLKTGTHVPFDMKDAKDTADNTELASRQILDNLKTQLNQEKDPWDKIIDRSDHKKIIYFGMLLSDNFFEKKKLLGIKIGDADTKLVNYQKRSIDKIAEDEAKGDFDILCGNEPLNGFRTLTWDTQHLWNSRWDVTNQLLSRANIFLDAVNEKGEELSEKQQLNKTLIEQAIENLTEMRKINISDGYPFSFGGRNYPIFKSAYSAILVEAMGGVVSSNCKSGKDRTGLEELYRHAMLLYFEETGQLPKYNDDEKNREKFIKIFRTLFNNMKISEVCSTNTPGAFGIKDSTPGKIDKFGRSWTLSPAEYGILCTDIREALGGEYKTTCKIAKINKVDPFSWVEKKVIKIKTPDKISSIEKNIQNKNQFFGDYYKSEARDEIIRNIDGQEFPPSAGGIISKNKLEKYQLADHIKDNNKSVTVINKKKFIGFVTEETIDFENKKVDFKFHASKEFDHMLEKEKMLLAIERVETFRKSCQLAGLKDSEYSIVIKAETDPQLAGWMEFWCKRNRYDYVNKIEENIKLKLDLKYQEFFDKEKPKGPWINDLEKQPATPVIPEEILPLRITRKI